MGCLGQGEALTLDRPLGISILAVVYGLLGTLLVGIGVIVVFMGFALQSLFPVFPLGLLVGSLAILPILVGVFAFIVAYGLWSLSEWGWWLATILTALGTVSSFYGLLPPATFSWGTFIGFVVAFAVLIYLVYVKDEFD